MKLEEPYSADDALEEPLCGGRLTMGVVRRGATVRRPLKESTAFVSRLLRLLEARGFTGAPRYLGQDEQQREILTFIPGSVAPKLRQFTNAQVQSAATLLRAFHEATRGSDLADSSTVVCHNDAGPYNTIFQADEPVAFIDFDLSAPGEPIEDLAYMAWLWCVSSKVHERPIEIQASQIRILADGYSLSDLQRPLLVDGILERQARNAAFWSERLKGFDGLPANPAEIQSRIDWSKREYTHTELYRGIFLAALC